MQQGGEQRKEKVNNARGGGKGVNNAWGRGKRVNKVRKRKKRRKRINNARGGGKGEKVQITPGEEEKERKK